MSPRRSPAGRSSQRKYDDLLRSWRRRQRKLFAIVGAICLCVLVASFIAAEMWPAGAWICGVFGGAALAFWTFARLSPPAWIENWQSGAWGEQATAKELAPLEGEGWIVLHDLAAERGNIDHIVVGVGGVFLLDSKRLGGEVSVDDSGVTVRRLDDRDLSYRHPGPNHLLGLARQTHDRVLAVSRINTWVSPVMVLWAEFPQGVVDDRCAYVHGEELAAWLRSRPPKIAAGRVHQWNRVGSCPGAAHEVNRDTVDGNPVVLVSVDGCLCRPPVEAVGPVASQRLEA